MSFLFCPDIIPIVSVIADNSLVYFLLSNIVMGLLNLSIDTLELADLTPEWLGNACQLALLTTYTLTCPFLAARVGQVIFFSSKRKKKM